MEKKNENDIIPDNTKQKSLLLDAAPTSLDNMLHKLQGA